MRHFGAHVLGGLYFRQRIRLQFSPPPFTSFHLTSDILSAMFPASSTEREARGGRGTMQSPLQGAAQVQVYCVMARLELFSHSALEGAASGGTPDALYQLGLMYCVGRDVELDLVEAHKWFNLAALRGNADAKRYRLEIALDMTKIQIVRAQRMAREWIATH
jgi:hypothetical protein